MTAYPPIEPYQQEQLDVGDGHRVYLEQCGNPQGLPVLFVHGGPAAGCDSLDRCFFNPDIYRIVLFDQRGCGRSGPLGSIEHNRTEHLLADMEQIRGHLEIERWVVFGGSWGSTLSLLYAQRFTERVLGLVLRGIYFGTRAENHWLWQEGMSHIFPEAYQRYRDFIPEEQRQDLLGAYHRILTGSDESHKAQAALSIMAWEAAALSLDPELNAGFAEKISVAQGIIETHYLANACFLPEGEIQNKLFKLTDIPTSIVHGRLDMITTCDNAWALHQALPQSSLCIVPGAGHASREPGILRALVAATDQLAVSLTAATRG